MQAVIMAGGKGTRLRAIAGDIPKPMIAVHGKSILEYQIESLKKSGITEITLIVGYLGEVIRKYFGNGDKFNITIKYIVEDKPLGTAGALFYLKDQIKDDFILTFGDLVFDVDFNRFMDFHKSTRGLITLYGHPNDHPYDSDIIIMDRKNKAIKIGLKNIERVFYYHNLVNAGLYCVNPKLLESINKIQKIDFEKKLVIDEIRKSNVYVYQSTEYVKDMGTPDRLETVADDIKNMVVLGRNLKNKQKAIFLDRDGTINQFVGYVKNINDFKLIKDVALAIKKINQSPYLAIVATNQPVIARGDITFQELENIHKKMETELGNQGAYVDDIFFCPHHPDKGYKGEIEELKIECDCRKPKSGMLLQAAEKYNIDLNQSWFIGDTTVDIQTGKNAGMRTVLVLTGEAEEDKKYSVEPDRKADSLLDAVKYILNLEK